MNNPQTKENKFSRLRNDRKLENSLYDKEVRLRIKRKKYKRKKNEEEQQSKPKKVKEKDIEFYRINKNQTKYYVRTSLYENKRQINSLLELYQLCLP